MESMNTASVTHRHYCGVTFCSGEPNCKGNGYIQCHRCGSDNQAPMYAHSSPLGFVCGRCTQGSTHRTAAMIAEIRQAERDAAAASFATWYIGGMLEERGRYVEREGATVTIQEGGRTYRITVTADSPEDE